MHLACTILSLYFLVTYEFILKCFIPSFNLYADAWHYCYAGQSITHGPIFFKFGPQKQTQVGVFRVRDNWLKRLQKNLETNIVCVALKNTHKQLFDT